jgi:transposase
VICVDEMGPVGAKSYPARRPTAAGKRAILAPDYARRGAVWVYGALAPATGWAFTQSLPARDGASFVAFLDALEEQAPPGTLYLLLDNLNTHRTLDVRLWALAHPRVRFVFQPPYAPWLNLIEPWWKTLRSLALQGRRIETADRVITAIADATAYWNAHRHPYRWRATA